MTSQERDPRTAWEAADQPDSEPDFAEEHDRPSYADEPAGRPGMEPDEATPSDRVGAGGLDPGAPIEKTPFE
ncbi:MAG TPA: hypothetical protein VGJ95_11275 [Pseudonocardiaceae bacterium]|jgi:hypothetical protein